MMIMIMMMMMTMMIMIMMMLLMMIIMMILRYKPEEMHICYICNGECGQESEPRLGSITITFYRS